MPTSLEGDRNNVDGIGLAVQVESRIGDLLWAFGHTAPQDKAVVAFAFDNGATIALDMMQHYAPSGLLGMADRAIEHCKVNGGMVTAFGVAASVDAAIDGRPTWSCFSSANNMDCAVSLYVACDNEGESDWYRLPSDLEGHGVDALAVGATQVWSYLSDNGVADLSNVTFMEVTL